MKVIYSLREWCKHLCVHTWSEQIHPCVMLKACHQTSPMNRSTGHIALVEVQKIAIGKEVITAA